MSEHETQTSPIPSATQAGHVRNTGDLVAGPSQWSAERTETGCYVVHHAIGSEMYVVMTQALIMDTQDPVFAVVTEERADYFAFRVFNLDGDLVNHDVQFLVVIGD